MRPPLAFLLAAVLTVTMSRAQQQAPQQPQQPAPQPAPTPSPAPSPSPGQPTTPSPGRTPSQQQQQQQTPWESQRDRSPIQEMQRPVFLSGKVVMDDGTPPPEPVVIERVCNGIARPEAYTDTKGRFSFQVGQNMGMIADASVSSAADGPLMGGSQRGMGGLGGPGSGISERELMGCELRANLAGFRSEVVNLAGRRAMDNPDVGTIILRRLGNVEGLTISATTALAPKDARKAFDKAKDQVKRQKWADARKELEKAVQLYPKFATAWYQLGLIHERQNDAEGARKAYGEALAADARFINPYLQLAQISAKEQKWQEVADTTGRVVKLNPFDFPQAYFYNAVANYNLRKLDAAETSAREAVKLDAQHRIAKASHLLGVILAQKEDYKGAAEHMENYLKFAPAAGDAEQVRKQLDEIRRVSGGGAPPRQD